jgi:hypothetical protein
VSENDFKLQTSYKFGEYDQHMVNVRADSGPELTGLLDAIDVQKVVDFGATVKAVQSALPVTTPTAAAPAAAPAAPAAPAPTAPPASQPAGQMCQHGPRTYRTGTSARGAWQAYFCPLPKGHPDQCDAVFL